MDIPPQVPDSFAGAACMACLLPRPWDCDPPLAGCSRRFSLGRITAVFPLGSSSFAAKVRFADKSVFWLGVVIW